MDVEHGAEAFGAILSTERPRLEAMARRITRDADVAQDVVGDAAIRVWQRLQNGGVDEPGAYLVTAVRNAALDHVRRTKRERAALQAVASRPAPPTSESRVDDRDEIDRLLAALTPVQRATLDLRYAHDRTEAEIADTLGIAAGTVKSHAHRALRRLRTEALVGCAS